MIWIIGGTSETRELLERIRRKDYLVTVVSYAGKDKLKSFGDKVLVNKLDYSGMVKFIAENGIDTVIDMSHPYAVEVSENAARACAESQTSYIRFSRERAVDEDRAYCRNIDDATELLRSLKGTVFFTTGIKNIKDFQKVRGENRFIYRVLPTDFSIAACKESGVEMSDIVAALGPFSKEFNMAMFENYSADCVVMKDSGASGGTLEKIKACDDLGIKAIIIGREDEAGFKSIEEILELI